jgi:hypothetical protein
MAMAVDRKDPHERAKRLARLVVGDVVLYNREKIEEGIRKDTLFEVLAKELEEARRYYEKSVDPVVAKDVDYFNLAVVDVLIKGRANIRSKIW